MVIEGGYILGPRRVYDDPLYKEMQAILKKRKPVIGLFRFHAMQDLFRRAQFADSGLKTDNQYIVVKRGQLFISVEKLAHEWGWSRHKVYNFLEYLEQKRDTIGTLKLNKGVLITIINYDDYQNPKNYKTGGRDTKRTMAGQSGDNGGTHNNELSKDNEGNELKRESEFSEDDMKWNDETNAIKDHWNENVRPKCIGWTDADKKSISAWLNKGITPAQITHGIDNYALVIKAKPGEYVWTYAGWSLKHFMQRGLERFMDDSFIASIAKKSKPVLGKWDGSEKGGRIQ